MFKSFDHSGGIVCWDSHRCERWSASYAFGLIGGADHIPPPNKLAALSDAAKAIAQESGLAGADTPNIKYFTLDRSRAGIGAHYEIRSVDENQYPHLFSVGLTGDTEDFTLLKDSRCLVSAAAQDAGSRKYAESIDYLTASDVTRAINSLLRKRHAMMLRENGGVYFLPGEFVEDYRKLADAIGGSGPTLHCWRVDMSDNDALLTMLHERLQETLLTRLEKRQAEWDELQARGGKPQDRGLQSRFEEMLDDARQLEYYEQFLSVRHDRIRTALEAQQSMIGMAHMALWEQPA